MASSSKADSTHRNREQSALTLRTSETHPEGSPSVGCLTNAENLAPARIPADTDTSYPRFVYWYATGANGGRRSYPATAQHFGVTEATLREMAQRGRWVERASAQDAKLLEKELTAGLSVQRKAVVAQVGLAERLTKVVEAAVFELEGLEGEAALDAIGPALEAVKALQRAQATLRLATGQSTSNAHVEVFSKGAAEERRDLDRLTPTQLELLTALEALDSISRGASEIELHPYQLSKLRHLEALIEARPHVPGSEYRTTDRLGDGRG